MSKTTIILISLIVDLIIADQVTKWWIVKHWQEFESVYVLPFFNLVLVYNKGAAFSFLANAGGWQNVFFISIASFATIMLIWMIRKSNQQMERIALGLILSGALGNLIDRICLGKVVDFLDFHTDSYHWPAFNVADSAITIGVVLIFMVNIFFRAK